MMSFSCRLTLLIALSMCGFQPVLSSIDKSTPADAQYVVGLRDGRTMRLTMSDEFETANRGFGKGKDKYFEAIEKPDYTNEAIQYYNSSKEYVTTEDGNLILATKAVKTKYLEWDFQANTAKEFTKNYTSGMIQTWNKFCFTGGVLEMSIELPGESDSGGIWPAAWLVGNLARATFLNSTTFVWPWSYNKCGEIDHLEHKQEINACDADPGFGLHPNQGRGAPEIDIFEVMPGHEMPGAGVVNAFMSSSLQVSPGLPKGSRRPINGQELNSTQSWYKGLKVGKNSKLNSGFWGQECGPELDETPELKYKYMEDAISVNTDLKATHFQQHHKYTLEWQPGPEGYLYWYLDDKLLLGIEAKSMEKLTGALIPEEPMYLVLNTAISHRWGMPEPCPVDSCSACWHCYDCTNPECQCSLPNGMKGCKNLPAVMRVDYIRLYQDPEDPLHSLGCSPESHPTAAFIAAHADRYRDWKSAETVSPTHSTLIQTVLGAVVLVALISVLYRLYRMLLASNARRSLYREIPEQEDLHIEE